MSDVEDAAKALEGFVPIGDDHPRVQEFRDAVLGEISQVNATDLVIRPSHTGPPVPLDEILARIESKLDHLIGLLSGGPP